MGESNFHSVQGIPKGTSLLDISKAYKSLVMKWHPGKNSSNKDEAKVKFRTINEAYRALSTKRREEEEETNKSSDEPTTPETVSFHRKPVGETFFSRFSRSISRRIHKPTPGLKSMSRNTSRITTVPPQRDFYASLLRTASTNSGGAATTISTPMTPKTPTSPPALSKMTSRRNVTPIIYSHSTTARRKPPPEEKKLECTLEELCHGCGKKIKITRDAISDSGMIVQEQEILKIKIKPGWKKGTRIIFEGKGDERPGSLPADIIFIIDEKRHPIFKREGDDLELGVEIPLVQALTGCTITVPLLGGEKMTLSFEDIIFPGYQKIIPGQGMPKSNGGRRGNLRLQFLVKFPLNLSDEQRSNVVCILNDCC